MPKTLLWKWITIGAVVLGCIFGVAGLPSSKEQLVANWKKNIRLGLDLQGGAHIVLQVQVQDAYKAEADQIIARIKDSLTKQNISFGSVDRNDPVTVDTAGTVQIMVKGVAGEKSSLARTAITEAAGGQWLLASTSSTDYTLSLKPEAAVELRRETMTQTMNTMERKISGLGVAEASVQQRGGSGGDTELLVQLPGLDDPARVRGILQTTALLELYPVKGGPFASRDQAYLSSGGVLPLGSKLMRGARTATDGGAESWWLVANSPVVMGRDIRDAKASPSDRAERWDTNFVLSQEAARRFGRYTETNIGQRLAIVLDKAVISAPVIEGRIEDQGRITGMGGQQEAADLALNLRAGSLPAGVKVIEERTVGPSLGADSIRRGVGAGLVGLALVVASMLLYYRGAGLNAVLALLLNTIITVAALSYIDATWTLPGIAGLVLSIGMAVDSNVLIFERIKEELRSGRAVPGSISSGFDRALVTIIDTHVTTVVASLFLFLFGTGPVRGFAVTLVIGLVANLFTAVFVSRAIFDWQLLRNPRLAELSIGIRRNDEAKVTTFDFLSRRALAMGLSALAIAVGIGSIVMHGGLAYGLDFRGGTLIYVRFDPKPSIDEVRTLLSSRLQGEISVQETRENGEFIIGTGLEDETALDRTRETVRQALREKFANTGTKLDLNNVGRQAIEERLRTAGVTVDDAALKAAVERIVDYRDRQRNGIVTNIDELASAAGPALMPALRNEFGLGSFTLRSAEMVGPKAGEQMRQQAVFATLGALAGMLVYIAYRFQWISGTAAVIATIHDVLITLGLFSLTGREINLNIIAALLTLIGYSMNDKIVVFDRVRENRLKMKGASLVDLVNVSINQTLSRTLLTAGPTLLACLALYFLGGEVLNGIAFALFVGIIAGTYSSIFVASALLVMWEGRKNGASSQTASAAVAR